MKPHKASHLVKRAWELVRTSLSAYDSSSADATPGADGSTPATPENTPPPAAARPADSRKILVVEASLAYQKKLAAAIRESGHEVVTVASSNEAVGLLSIERFGAVVVDMQIPDAGGFEVCRRIRGGQGDYRVPIMLMVGRAITPEVRKAAMGAGADEVVAKSPEVESIAASLRALLRRRRMPPTERPTTVPPGSSSARPITVPPGSSSSAKPTPIPASSNVRRPTTVPPGSNARPAAVPTTGSIGVKPTTIPPSSNVRRPTTVPPGSSRLTASASAGGVARHATNTPRNNSDRPPQGESGPRLGPWPEQEEAVPGSLFHRVIQSSGLSGTLGPPTIGRACERAGVDPKTMEPHDLARALPAIRDSLSLFLPPEERDKRFAAITALAAAPRKP